MPANGDSQIYFGDTLKVLDESGRVGGYLVRFSDAEHKDLDGEYFTPETYLGSKDGDGVDTYFHHGKTLNLPDTVADEVKAEVKALADYVFAPIKTTRDAIGIFAEVVLDMAKQYEEMVHGLVKQGKLGWSSGAISHLVRKESDGQLKRWPIGEASLTPTPCEPLNRAIPVKSLANIDFKMFGKKSTLDEETGTPSSDEIKQFLESPEGQEFLKGITESESFESFDSAVSELEKFAQKMQSNHDNRVKDGRVLSASNRAKVQAAYDACGALLAASEPKPKEKSIDVNALRTQSLRMQSEALAALA